MDIIVRRGDTLAGIARRTGVSLPELLRANPQIRNPNLIHPGQQIQIPGTGRQTRRPFQTVALRPVGWGPSSRLALRQSQFDHLVTRTTVGEVLENFFSPFSSERLWVMGPTDPYTVIVRNWQPVMDEIALARSSIETNCSAWASNHTTSGGFTPTMSYPPTWDPRAYVRSVRSPPGTDPDTCRDHFIPYIVSRGAGLLVPPLWPLPPIETETLHTCAIGSFAIGITVDSIDCTAKTATMSVWIFNAMSRESFGRFASQPVFRASGMQRQYMWWHWTESHAWGAPVVSGGNSSGSGRWSSRP